MLFVKDTELSLVTSMYGGFAPAFIYSVTKYVPRDLYLETRPRLASFRAYASRAPRLKPYAETPSDALQSDLRADCRPADAVDQPVTSLIRPCLSGRALR